MMSDYNNRNGGSELTSRAVSTPPAGPKADFQAAIEFEFNTARALSILETSRSGEKSAGL